MEQMRVLVAGISFTDSPFNTGVISDMFPGVCREIRDWYLAISYGMLEFVVDYVPVAIPVPMSTTESPQRFQKYFKKFYGNTGPFPSYGAYDPTLENALRAEGHDPDLYARLVYYTQGGQVAFKGAQFGQTSWIWGASWNWPPETSFGTFDALHELGHGFGVGHAATITGATFVGDVMTFKPITNDLSAEQKRDTADHQSTMGYRGYFQHFSAGEKERMGWVLPQTYAGGVRNYSLGPFELHPHALRIDMNRYLSTTQRSYWLEYRKKGLDPQYVGNDNELLEGIQIRVMDRASVYAFAYILDPAMPEIQWPLGSQRALQVGQSFTDGTIRVDFTGFDASGFAQLTVSETLPTNPPPQKPTAALSVVSVSWL